MKVKKRLDVLLTERNLADSRSKAQAVIMSGLVYVDGQKADKPGVSYDETVEIEVRGAACPYVSRGGLKLEKALRDFGVKTEGCVCSDSGASTGGFTDCLLQHGAKKVFAIDVGYGQLDWKIRSDPRVVVSPSTTLKSPLQPGCLRSRVISNRLIKLVSLIESSSHLPCGTKRFIISSYSSFPSLCRICSLIAVHSEELLKKTLSRFCAERWER